MTKKEQKSLEEALALMSEMYMTEKVNAERLEKALTAMERDRDRLLANAHAAVPGPPTEDGVWEIRTHNGNEYIAKARAKINGRWYWECGVNYIPEEAIVAHRKHIPLEVPQ